MIVVLLWDSVFKGTGWGETWMWLDLVWLDGWLLQAFQQSMGRVLLAFSLKALALNSLISPLDLLSLLNSGTLSNWKNKHFEDGIHTMVNNFKLEFVCRLWMVCWHLGLFLCLTFGQIGFKGRTEDYFSK